MYLIIIIQSHFYKVRQKFRFDFLSQYWKGENTLRALKRGYVWYSVTMVLKRKKKSKGTVMETMRGKEGGKEKGR